MDPKQLFSLEGKVALVTGGSRGIGLMIAGGLASAGARVYVASRKVEACEAAARELAPHGDCRALPGNLASQAGTRALADALAEREASLHVLVNNAGCNWAAPLRDYPEAGWDKVMALNVKAAFDLTRFLLPQLEAAARPEDPARVLNVGSIDGIRPPELEIYAYAASKAAIHHLTRMLAKRLASVPVTVNALAPGPFESRMMAETLRRFGDAIRASCPLGRIGTPEDVAGAAIYLASRAGAYVTGAVIPVDGGIATTR